jgi:hypothetical protein
VTKQLQLEIDPLLSEPYVVYVFGELNARGQGCRFATPEGLLSCLTDRFGIETETAAHAVIDLRKRGTARIGRA